MRDDPPGQVVSSRRADPAAFARWGGARMSGAAAQAIDVVRRGRKRVSARTLSLAGLGVYLAATVVLVTADGIPLSRDMVFGWILLGMLAASLADLRGFARGVIFDWLPFFGLLFAYDFLRGAIGSDPLFVPHVLPQIDFDEFIFGTVPSVGLQARFFDPTHIDALDIAAWAVYVSHFFTVFIIAALLWRIARPRFLEFRAMVLTLTAATFVTYALFPAVPPWMASEDGVIGPVQRTIGEVWRHLGVNSAATMWDYGSAFSNQVAAVPSLHTAYPVLILCFFWSSGWPARLLGLTYALAMSATLVFTGEHYVFDIALGWLYAIVTFLAVSQIRAAWARRRGAADPADPANGAVARLDGPVGLVREPVPAEASPSSRS